MCTHTRNIKLYFAYMFLKSSCCFMTSQMLFPSHKKLCFVGVVRMCVRSSQNSFTFFGTIQQKKNMTTINFRSSAKKNYILFQVHTTHLKQRLFLLYPFIILVRRNVNKKIIIKIPTGKKIMESSSSSYFFMASVFIQYKFLLLYSMPSRISCLIRRL